MVVEPVLVVDTEPNWIRHWQQKGADTCETVDAALALIAIMPPYSRVIVSSLFLADIPRLALQASVEVVTYLPTIQERVAAYRGGAKDYWVKEFG